jgi:uncharacterized membrane protein
VLIVAFLYSLTASFDKLGMSSSTSTAFYIMMQRLLIAAVSLAYLLLGTPRTLRHLYRDAVLLVALSLAEQLAIVLYFKAIQNILVGVLCRAVLCRAGVGVSAASSSSFITAGAPWCVHSGALSDRQGQAQHS